MFDFIVLHLYNESSKFFLITFLPHCLIISAHILEAHSLAAMAGSQKQKSMF